MKFIFSTLIALLLIAIAHPTVLTTTNASHLPGQDNCEPLTDFDRRNFSQSTEIDNKWLPLKPGTQLTLEGRANRGGGALPHTVVFTVTDLVKEIDGVKTVVVWDVDTNEDEVVEAELAFFAQDNNDNVWNLGEYPEEYENGEFVGAPNTWIAGEEEAEAGVHMMARPKLGTPSYLQGSAPEIDFLDCGQVFSKNQNTCVPVKCYSDVLITDEWSPLDPDSGHQQKYHAPFVGIIQVGAVDDPEGETLVLTKVEKLGSRALKEAREEALALEEHAYEVSEVYGETSPAKANSLPSRSSFSFDD